MIFYWNSFYAEIGVSDVLFYQSLAPLVSCIRPVADVELFLAAGLKLVSSKGSFSWQTIIINYTIPNNE
jgi:hypothetical protein